MKLLIYIKEEAGLTYAEHGDSFFIDLYFCNTIGIFLKCFYLFYS